MKQVNVKDVEAIALKAMCDVTGECTADIIKRGFKIVDASQTDKQYKFSIEFNYKKNESFMEDVDYVFCHYKNAFSELFGLTNVKIKDFYTNGHIDVYIEF